jgi:5-methylcytosine-specific restriction endonuclease McrA
MNIKRVPNCICSICSKPIYRRPLQIASGNVFCSSVCCGKNQRVERTCNVCGLPYIGAKRTCSRACANKGRSGIKYLGLNEKNNARQGMLLKEKVAKKHGGVCQRCGENNYAILQTHHKKERYRGGKDTLTNLELLCPNCHATYHMGHSLFQKKKDARVLRQR